MTKNTRKKVGKLTALLLWTLALAVVLPACSAMGGKEKGKALGTLGREDKGSLKIAYFNEQAFYMQYGNAFQAMFPNVELQVVSTDSVFGSADPVAEMEKLVKEQQPDVMFLTEEQYTRLAKQGELYDLDAVVKQDQFNLDDFVPSVIRLLKAHGGGKLYGLSPSFSSQALYYNKDLFDKYGIPYPTDRMSWEDIMKLASRFPAKKDGDDAFNGLFQSSQTTDAFELIRTIGEAKGLTYADAEAGTVSIQSPEWKTIFQSVIDGYKSGSLSMPSEGTSNQGGGMMRSFGGKMAIRIGPDTMRFLSGQAAMTIDGPLIINFMGMNMQKMNVKDSGKGNGPKNLFKDINWDLVTVPVDPSQPDVAGGTHLDSVFSIRASSDNLPAAWEFVKYANGEQLAKTGTLTSQSLSTRNAYKKTVDGKNTDAFYALEANDQTLLQDLPGDFAVTFAELASGKIKNVVDGSQTVDEALKAIQTQGQDMLTQAKLKASQG